MKRTNICLMVLFLIFHYPCYSGGFDTSKLILNAKMNIVPFNGAFIDEDFLYKILHSSSNIKHLKSKGFRDIFFFSLEINSDSTDSFGELMTDNLHLNNYVYYFGYNTKSGELLLLKGFLRNDFRQLLTYAETTNFDTRDFKTTKEFSNAYYVEGLDMSCLYNYYQEEIMRRRKILKYDCIRPNSSVNANAWKK